MESCRPSVPTTTIVPIIMKTFSSTPTSSSGGRGACCRPTDGSRPQIRGRNEAPRDSSSLRCPSTSKHPVSGLAVSVALLEQRSMWKRWASQPQKGKSSRQRKCHAAIPLPSCRGKARASLSPCGLDGEMKPRRVPVSGSMPLVHLMNDRTAAEKSSSDDQLSRRSPCSEQRINPLPICGWQTPRKRLLQR